MYIASVLFHKLKDKYKDFQLTSFYCVFKDSLKGFATPTFSLLHISVEDERMES